jgi:CubicO group peptidase (beta-lactamase class C family)
MAFQVQSVRHLGLDESRWDRAVQLANTLVAQGVLPTVVFQVVTPEGMSTPSVAGRTSLSHAAPARADSIFLTASLSKPLVAMAVLRLVEAGLLSLQDRVAELIPEFDAAPRRAMTLRHLLTHTSGLPDMLPNNRALRTSQAELSRFVTGTCAVTLDFPPGRGVQYQSMGFALLGEIIARVSGVSCGEYLRREIFEPLGMRDSVLGASAESLGEGGALQQRLVEVRVPEDQRDGIDWNWNSRYWRALGAPWGGVLSTVPDLSRFLQMMLRGGELGGARLFAPATIEAATTNQLESLHDLPDADRRTRGWGYGWRLNWTGHSACFGDLLSPATYGHWGATGTLWWVDPVREVGLVLLTSQPLERDRTEHLRLSNAIAAAIVG